MAEGELRGQWVEEAAKTNRDGGAAVTARRGFFPIVCGNEVEVSQGGGLVFLAKDELEVERGGGQWMVALRKLEVEQGGCAVMVAGRAEVSRGFVGVLLSLRSEFRDGARVMMTLPQALAAGAAAGLVVAFVRLWKANDLTRSRYPGRGRPR